MGIKKNVSIALLVTSIFTSTSLFAKDFNVKAEVKKCQKCHGEKFDHKVLNSTKKLSMFSKKDLLASFSKYDKAPAGGKKGLMKLIIKKYNKQERNKIADYIISKR